MEQENCNSIPHESMESMEYKTMENHGKHETIEYETMENHGKHGNLQNESMESMGSIVFPSILLSIISRKPGKHRKHGKKAWDLCK